jgi:segregation and condensation protein A
VSEQESFDPGRHAYSVSLPSFEGPLDLLLHLCQKHELDILEIPVGFVTEKYLEYLALMTTLNLDLAAEYLVMAATLIHIKSKMLLPQVPAGQDDDAIPEEEEDPREALVRRLLEYQKYKKAGAELTAMGLRRNEVFLRGSAIETTVPEGPAPLAQVPIFSLLDAFQRVIEKSKVKFTHDIVADRISLTDRIHEIVDFLRDKSRVNFEDLFAGAKTRFDLVITFLALLEMGKLRMTLLSQDESYGALFVELAGTDVNADELPRHTGHAEAGTSAFATPGAGSSASSNAKNNGDADAATTDPLIANAISAVSSPDETTLATEPAAELAERVNYAELSAEVGAVFETAAAPAIATEPEPDGGAGGLRGDGSRADAPVAARAAKPQSRGIVDGFNDDDDDLPEALKDALRAVEDVMARRPGVPYAPRVAPPKFAAPAIDAVAADARPPVEPADEQAEPQAEPPSTHAGEAVDQTAVERDAGAANPDESSATSRESAAAASRAQDASGDLDDADAYAAALRYFDDLSIRVESDEAADFTDVTANPDADPEAESTQTAFANRRVDATDRAAPLAIPDDALHEPDSHAQVALPTLGDDTSVASTAPGTHLQNTPLTPDVDTAATAILAVEPPASDEHQSGDAGWVDLGPADSAADRSDVTPMLDDMHVADSTLTTALAEPEPNADGADNLPHTTDASTDDDEQIL